jgi:hypothetical protein
LSVSGRRRSPGHKTSSVQPCSPSLLCLFLGRARSLLRVALQTQQGQVQSTTVCFYPVARPPDGMPSSAQLATGDGLVCTCCFSDCAISLSCMHSFRRPVDNVVVVVLFLSWLHRSFSTIRPTTVWSRFASITNLQSSHSYLLSFRAFFSSLICYARPHFLMMHPFLCLSCRRVSSRCFVRASCMHACFSCAFLIDTT